MARGWTTTSSQTEKRAGRSHRQQAHFWPSIRAWLEAPHGQPPLPVCSACATTLTIWGVPAEEGPELPLTPESLEDSEATTHETPCSQVVVGRACARSRESVLSAKARHPLHSLQ